MAECLVYRVYYLKGEARIFEHRDDTHKDDTNKIVKILQFNLPQILT